MKIRHLFLLGAALASTLWANAEESLTTIWEGSQALGNWANTITIDAAKFAEVENWNFIRLTISEIDPAGTGQYPQVGVKINADGWPSLDCTANVQLSEPGEYDFRVNEYGAADLKTYGALIQGSWGVVTKVEILTGFEPQYPSAIWTGPVDMGDSWGVWAQLDHSCFKRAQVGDVIRFYVSDIRAGAMGIMQYAAANYAWTTFARLENYQSIAGTYFEYEITEDLLPILKGENNEKGIIVSGINYTLEAMSIIDAGLTGNAISCTVDHSDLVFINEEPKLSFKFTPISDALKAYDTYTYKIDVFTDKMEKVASASGESTSTTIEAALPVGEYEAGVFKYNLSICDIFIEAYNFVLNPEQIVAADDSRSDFEAFWEAAKAQLASIDPNYSITEIPEYSGSVRKVYLVEMQSVPDGDGEPVTIRAHYAVPIAEGTYPCIITYQGYDGGGDLYPPSGAYNGDWCELVLSTRGQMINNREPYENTYGDWFAYGFDSKDHYYYRGAFMDAVRAIDFVASRPEVQKENIFAQGQSQGGALTIAACALSDGRISAIAPAVQFLGDFPNYFQVASWPASVAFACQKQYGMSDEEMYEMLSYFDTKNLAKWVTVPVYSSMSLQDDVCPLRTNLAPYNNFASKEKKYVINNTLGHAVANAWYTDYLDFFRDHIVSSGIPGITADDASSAPKEYYNLQGIRIADPAPGSVYILRQGTRTSKVIAE